MGQSNKISERMERERQSIEIGVQYRGDPQVRREIIARWSAETEMLRYRRVQETPTGTIPYVYLMAAAAHFRTSLLSSRRKLSILEVFSGNCMASRHFASSAAEMISEYICTDICKYSTLYTMDTMKFEQLSSVDAVAKYGDRADILLMISPPAAGPWDDNYLADYYACEDFIKCAVKSESAKYIVYVGELGGADGSEGMYKYLTNLKLFSCEEICRDRNVLGGECVKYIYVFATSFFPFRLVLMIRCYEVIQTHETLDRQCGAHIDFRSLL